MRLHEILTEGVAGPKSCWPGHRKVGTKPGTGKNKGKRVNDCEKIKEDTVEEAAPEMAKMAGGLGLGLVAAAGAPAIVGILGPLLGIPFAAYGAYTAAKLGMKGVEKLWDMATEKLGSDEEVEQYTNARIDKLPPKQRQAAIAIIKQLGESRKNQGGEDLLEEFDMIESIIESIADQHAVDADLVWEDLAELSDDELYVFAVTSNIINEDWQKANKRDKTDGMSKKAVNAYRRENPGSKLKTAVTTKPSKLKKGSKASKRRKSYCSRSRGQMKMHSISCAKTPDKAICKARRRWNC
jgi:hypothetical protein